MKDLPSLNISCKIKVAHTYSRKCVQESYQPYVPPCAWKSQECGPFLPLPGILRQFCLELLAADESCTKGSASSRSRQQPEPSPTNSCITFQGFLYPSIPNHRPCPHPASLSGIFQVKHLTHTPPSDSPRNAFH